VLPVTVRLTEVTADAVAGTVSWAWSCRGADLASTAPRSHEDVPSSLPQPKVKTGYPPLAGDACSWMTASGMLPPVAHALTFHWAECPRSLLACAGVTSTQRLTCAAGGAVLPPLDEMASAAVAVGVAVGVGFAVWVRLCAGLCLGLCAGLCLGLCAGSVDEVVGVALSEALGVPVWVADADGLAFVVVPVGVGAADGVFAGDFTTAFGVVAFGVAVGLDVSLRVGAGVASDGGVAG
jgi:hypothetical protein